MNGNRLSLIRFSFSICFRLCDFRKIFVDLLVTAFLAVLFMVVLDARLLEIIIQTQVGFARGLRSSQDGQGTP